MPRLNICLVVTSSLLVACAPERDYVPRVIGGDLGRGRAALAKYECGVCHVIPGVPHAVGKVGPSLDHYSHRSYVAGKFPNEPETLVRFIINPPAMAPQTAMPALGMSEQEALDMAAYLYESESLMSRLPALGMDRDAADTAHSYRSESQ